MPGQAEKVPLARTLATDDPAALGNGIPFFVMKKKARKSFKTVKAPQAPNSGDLDPSILGSSGSAKRSCAAALHHDKTPNEATQKRTKTPPSVPEQRPSLPSAVTAQAPPSMVDASNKALNSQSPRPAKSKDCESHCDGPQRSQAPSKKCAPSAAVILPKNKSLPPSPAIPSFTMSSKANANLKKAASKPLFVPVRGQPIMFFNEEALLSVDPSEFSTQQDESGAVLANVAS